MKTLKQKKKHLHLLAWVSIIFYFTGLGILYYHTNFWITLAVFLMTLACSVDLKFDQLEREIKEQEDKENEI